MRGKAGLLIGFFLTVCSFSDNGIGISEEYHKKVFGLFEQVDGKTAGTGTGLAIVKSIVENHEGKIWIENTPEQRGCKFCFYIGTKGT